MPHPRARSMELSHVEFREGTSETALQLLGRCGIAQKVGDVEHHIPRAELLELHSSMREK